LPVPVADVLSRIPAKGPPPKEPVEEFS
jgi:hypothetical protein